MASKYLMISFKEKDAAMLDRFYAVVPKGKRSSEVAALIALKVAELEAEVAAKQAQLAAETVAPQEQVV